jgi:hypothetical protein
VDTGDTYSKSAGAWGLIGNLMGPAGSQGLQGAAVPSWGNPSIPAGNTVVNTTTATIFGSKCVIPANTLAVQNVIRVHCAGVYSAAASIGPASPTATGINGPAAATLKLLLKAGSVNLADTGTMQIEGQTGYRWEFDCVIRVGAVGASGSVSVSGTVKIQNSAGVMVALTLINMSVSTSLDTTISETIQMSAQWSAAAAGNTVTLNNMSVELLNGNGLITG